MPEPYFASAYMRLLYRFVQPTDDAEGRFLEGTGVTVADLLAADARLSFATQMQLCRNAIAIGPPGLGLRIGAQLQLAAHGALGTAMQHAASLGDALRTFAELVPVRASFATIAIVQRARHAELQLRFDGLPEDVHVFFTESILSTLQYCAALHTGHRAPFTAIELAYAEPPHAHAYREAFATRIAFGRPVTAVHVAHARLAMGTLDSDPQLHADAVRRCRAEIEARAMPTDVVHAVEHVLWRQPGRIWRVDEVADALSIGARTLLRRLRACGTTFQAVRDGVLKQQAVTLLRAGSVASAAASLGFADESSFRRTYKRWFGHAPRSVHAEGEGTLGTSSQGTGR